MKLAPAAIASIGALLTFVQQTPAPVNIVIPAVLGSIASGFTGKAMSEINNRGVLPMVRRDDDPFAGLPQPAADQCKGQLKDTTVNFSPKPNNGVRIDNVPSSCMTLATVFLKSNADKAAAIPMGMC